MDDTDDSEEELDPSILNSGETVVKDEAKSSLVEGEKSTLVEEGAKSTKSLGDGLKCTTTPFEAENQCNVPLFIHSFFIASLAVIYLHVFVLFL